jgi:putative endonuclease
VAGVSDAPVILSDAPVIPSDAPVIPSDAPVISNAPVTPSNAPVLLSDAPVTPSNAPVILSEAKDLSCRPLKSVPNARSNMRHSRPMKKGGFVYIATNCTRTVLYTGVTSSLERRLLEHRNKTQPLSFTAFYSVDRLVYFERYESITEAIGREKSIKGKTRAKKIALIESLKPGWEDLGEPSLRSG